MPRPRKGPRLIIDEQGIWLIREKGKSVDVVAYLMGYRSHMTTVSCDSIKRRAAGLLRELEEA